MSKVVILNTPLWGHIMPTIALTRELLQQGEDVVYYTTPSFQDTLTRTGATVKLIPPSITERLEAFDSSKGLDLLYQWRFFLDQPNSAIDWFIETVRHEAPDYIINDFVAILGRIASHVTGIPRIVSVPVFCYHELSIIQQFPLFLLRVLFSLHEIPRIDAIVRRYKLRYKWPARRSRLAFTDYGPLNIVSTTRRFQPWSHKFSDRFFFTGPMLSSRTDARIPNPSDSINRPTVLISLGTLFNKNLGFYCSCIHAFKDSDLHVILVVGEQTSPDSLGPLPENIEVFGIIRQVEVLQHVDGFVTQGGMNSVHEALYYQVPLVVVPQSIDQFFMARRVHELGVGIHLKRPTIDGLQKAVHRILHETSFREQVSAWSQSFKSSGGAKQAVDAIFDFKRTQGIS